MLRIAAGGWFELYDLFMTAYIALGLFREKLFVATSASPFDLHGFASYAAAGFAGMYAGTLFFGTFSDRLGRKRTFVVSLLWYSAATLVMAFMHRAETIVIWRFIAGLGIGVQLITIDAYITEIAPRDARGYWIAFSQLVGYTAIPVAALAAYLLVPHEFGGLAGWRYVVLVGTLGGVFVWFFQSGLPESARWRAQRQEHISPFHAWRTIWNATYRARTALLVVFNLAQTIGFYGFTTWVPVFVAAHGVGLTKSLQYSFLIAIVSPLGPFLAMHAADRWERKWQIVSMALVIAGAGVLFSLARLPALLITLGIAITLANAWFSCAFHAYQAELYPTYIRAQAIGFVYSWSRFSSIFVGFVIAAALRSYGTLGAFCVIAGAMIIVALTIGIFGMRTNNRPLEELAAA
jgi:putative MFS transporter